MVVERPDLARLHLLRAEEVEDRRLHVLVHDPVVASRLGDAHLATVEGCNGLCGCHAFPFVGYGRRDRRRTRWLRAVRFRPYGCVVIERCWRCNAEMEWRHGTWQCPRCRFKLGCCEGKPQTACDAPQSTKRSDAARDAIGSASCASRSSCSPVCSLRRVRGAARPGAQRGGSPAASRRERGDRADVGTTFYPRRVRSGGRSSPKRTCR